MLAALIGIDHKTELCHVNVSSLEIRVPPLTPCLLCLVSVSVGACLVLVAPLARGFFIGRLGKGLVLSSLCVRLQ